VGEYMRYPSYGVHNKSRHDQRIGPVLLVSLFKQTADALPGDKLGTHSSRRN